MASIDDDTKQAIIDAYLKADPTPETSMSIVTDLAQEYEASPNSLRMILSNAGVYVKKTAATKPAASSKTASSEDKPARKSKQSSIDELSEALRAVGAEVDDSIVSKLTGKAADYFNSVIRNINSK